MVPQEEAAPQVVVEGAPQVVVEGAPQVAVEAEAAVMRAEKPLSRSEVQIPFEGVTSA
jgi:hypothetical protein